MEQRFNVKVTVNPNVAMRMPHFEIKGLSEEQLQREMGASFLAAAGLADKTASQPNGFGKSDGRGHFPGKKRHRGKRGGQRQKFGHGGEKPRYQKDQRDAAKPEDARIASAKAEDASPAKQAVPEKGLDKKSPEKEAAKKAGKTPEKKTSRPKAATKRVEDKKEPKAKKAAPAPKTSEEKAGKKTKAPARQVKKAAPKAAESAAVKPKAKKTGPTRRGWWQKAVGGK